MSTEAQLVSMHSMAQQMLESLQSITNTETSFNFSPIFHRQINQHDGIKITGRFSTTDSTASTSEAPNEGRMSYITVNRHTDAALPWDGFGIAWRQQEYDINDASQVAAAKYNVYLVDNDALSSEVMIMGNQMLDQTGGINNFVAAAKVPISPNTWHKFQINIYSHLGVDVWIYKEADWIWGNATPPKSKAQLVRGQSYPPYQKVSTGEHFGVSVYGTKNFEWNYDDLNIVSIVQNYPMHLFKLKADASHFESGKSAHVMWRGSGYGVTEGGVKVYARTFTGSAGAKTEGGWELLGSHIKSPNVAGFDPYSSDLLIDGNFSDVEPYRDSNEFVNLLAVPNNINDSEHFLRSYWAGLENITVSGVHIGGKSDIYVHDPKKIQIGQIAGTAGNNLQIIGDLTVSLQDVTGINFPIVDIISITNSEFNDIVYADGVDYTVARTSSGKEFSVNDPIYLNFHENLNGVTVSINYRYSELVQSVQNTFELDDFRSVSTDNLVKNCPLALVTIENFTYDGAPSEQEMDTFLIDFINSITDKKLEKSDLINVAYQNGATYVASSFNIQVKRYELDGDKQLTTSVADNYELAEADRTTMFFSDSFTMINTKQRNSN